MGVKSACYDTNYARIEVSFEMQVELNFCELNLYYSYLLEGNHSPSKYRWARFVQ